MKMLILLFLVFGLESILAQGGVPLWLWLAISMMTGILLLRSERLTFRSHVVAALHGEQPMLRGVVDSGRRVLAGLLLLLPGVLSDALALMLLLLPINTGEPQAAHAGRGGARRGAIDGEFRRLE